MVINIQEIKNKILKFLKEKGPSLPVHIAREIKLSPMFTSAILSELLDEKNVILSNLKIGSSPLYLMPGDEQKLEKFAEENLTGVEKEAYKKLKNEGLISDETQSPAIRVALRSIRDFTEIVNKDNKIYWKYKFSNKDIKIETPNQEESKETKREETNEKRVESIFDNETISKTQQKEESSEDKKEQKTKPKAVSTQKKQTKAQKQKQNFLEEIKEFLSRKNIQIINTINIDKKEITARINIKDKNGQDKQALLVAYNKKRVTEKDILKASKKSSELDLQHYVLSKGEPTKKMSETVEAYQKMIKMDNIE